MRPIEVPWLVGNNAKLRAQTDWEPQFTLEATLADVLAAARAASA